ncbi:hypothetical protein GGR57DRAFT_449131 [Xylariaceae sp. FL1272]|nr:hypothetical protein GGR57DRAFT_449131 [Xylariaceae sp. FL1272]
MPMEPPNATRPTLRGLLGQYPIQTRIFRELDTRSIVNLCQTSYGMRTDIRAYLWEINEKLERYFDNPQAFRAELGRVDGLISGSFALQFFACTYWPESDLDLNIREGEGVEEMTDYLIEREGYIFSTDKDIEHIRYAEMASYGTLEEVSRVITFYKGNTKSNSRDERKVQIVATKQQPVKAILNGYYTTCIMNFISWNKAYCIFPRATLLFHETVPLTEPSDSNVALHRKYSRRGYRIRTAPVYVSHDTNSHDPRAMFHMPRNSRYRKKPFRSYPLGHHPPEDRFIGGPDTWTMPLNTRGVQRPEKPDSVLECSSFQIRGTKTQANNGDGGGISLRAGLFVSPSLKYEYTCGSLSPYWERVGYMLQRNTLGQLRTKFKALDLEDLIESQNNRAIWSMNFEKPDGWDYWDDDLPDVFEGLQAEQDEDELAAPWVWSWTG